MKDDVIHKLSRAEIRINAIIDLLGEIEKDYSANTISVENSLLKAKKSLTYFKNKLRINLLKEKEKLLSHPKMSYFEKVKYRVLNIDDHPPTVTKLINLLFRKQDLRAIEQIYFLNRKSDNDLREILKSDIYLLRLKKQLYARSGN